MLRLAIVSAVPLMGSAAYLMFASEYAGNAGRPGGVAAWLLIVLALGTLAGVGYLKESRVVTAAYHVLLCGWFFTFAFPYLGEYL
jgi:hypothetical protein